jgi:hypothetical protein
MLTKCRQKRALDEPRCEAYRTENAAITAELIAMQEFQTRILAEIDALKSEKSSILHQKVNFDILQVCM